MLKFAARESYGWQEIELHRFEFTVKSFKLRASSLPEIAGVSGSHLRLSVDHSQEGRTLSPTLQLKASWNSLLLMTVPLTRHGRGAWGSVRMLATALSGLTS